MTSGIFAGIFWALETVLLGAALSMPPFSLSEEAVFLAPFVSTFLHDLCSAVWAAGFNLCRGGGRSVFRVWNTKSGRLVMLAAVIGGPVGMTGYVLAVRYMGASVGAVASAVFPAIGSVLAVLFLKEKMQWYRWLFLLATLGGVYGLSYSPQVNVQNFWLGLLGVLLCSFGWGIEAVILAKSLRDKSVRNEYALQIRQTTSASVNGLIVLPLVRGWRFTVELFTGGNGKLFLLLALAALCATASYLFYYKAIVRIGASKAMALDVTYAAWAIPFTALFLRDTSALTPLTVGCALVVIVCGVLAAANWKELTVKKKE